MKCASALLPLLLAGCVSARLGQTPPPRPGEPQAGALAAAPSPTPTPAPTPSYPQNAPLDAKKPVKLRSDRLRYNDRLKETEFLGNVVAVHDSTVLSADQLRSSTRGESASVKGKVRLLDESRKLELLAEEGDYSNSLAEANLRGGVAMHSVDPYARPVTLSSASAWYHSVSRLARMEGGVRVERGRLSATAGTAFLEEDSSRILLEGGVEASLGGNRVRSRRAVVDGKSSSLAFEGDVDARITPKELRDAAAHPERD